MNLNGKHTANPERDVSMMRQLWDLCTPRERTQATALFGAMIVRAGVAMVGVASIMPFMSVVADRR